VLGQISESVFHRLFETLFKVVIESANEREPLTLDLRASLDEQVISFHHLISNYLERVLEISFFLLQAIFLLLDEFLKHVELLLNLSKSSRMNLFEFFNDSHLVFLEFLNLFEDFLAFASACVDECIGSCTPVKSFDTRLNGTIEKIEVLFEKKLFFFTDCVNNVVVVSHNEHHVLSQDS